MKIYTVKNEDGELLPKAILETADVHEAVRDGKIVSVDYGMDRVQKFIDSPRGKGLSLAVCDITEIE